MKKYFCVMAFLAVMFGVSGCVSNQKVESIGGHYCVATSQGRIDVTSYEDDSANESCIYGEVGVSTKVRVCNYDFIWPAECKDLK
jgi:hypothetical protein